MSRQCYRRPPGRGGTSHTVSVHDRQCGQTKTTSPRTGSKLSYCSRPMPSLYSVCACVGMPCPAHPVRPGRGGSRGRGECEQQKRPSLPFPVATTINTLDSINNQLWSGISPCRQPTKMPTLGCASIRLCKEKHFTRSPHASETYKQSNTWYKACPKSENGGVFFATV